MWTKDSGLLAIALLMYSKIIFKNQVERLTNTLPHMIAELNRVLPGIYCSTPPSRTETDWHGEGSTYEMYQGGMDMKSSLESALQQLSGQTTIANDAFVAMINLLYSKAKAYFSHLPEPTEPQRHRYWRAMSSIHFKLWDIHRTVSPPKSRD